MSNAAAAAAAMKPVEKASSFAMTCNLLSQFIKDKGRSLGDLGLATPILNRPPTTMNLLPGVDASAVDAGESRNATKSMDLFPQRAGAGFGPQTPPAADKRQLPEKSQLTIFYGGKVLVFDQFPADKARDLMMLAGKGCGGAATKNTGAPPAKSAPPTEPKKPNNLSSNFVVAAATTNTAAATVPACPPRPAQAVASDLPIARKASLHRFLEKRKDRINAKSPYQVKDSSDPASAAITPKIEENQPWLGLKPSLNSDCSR